jgi:hypothetical protein
MYDLDYYLHAPNTELVICDHNTTGIYACNLTALVVSGGKMKPTGFLL